jgi:hypothetical protein
MIDPRAAMRRLLDGLADRLDLFDVEDLVEVGEVHVAFETLGDLVYEYDVALTADELRLVDELAASWSHDPSYHRPAQFTAACLHASGPRGADGRWPTRLVTVAHFKGSDALRRGIRFALDVPGDPDDELPPASTVAMPHALDIHDWDVLRAAHPDDARALLEWLLAAPDMQLKISDSSDAPVDPATELRRLSTPSSAQ